MSDTDRCPPFDLAAELDRTVNIVVNAYDISEALERHREGVGFAFIERVLLDIQAQIIAQERSR